MKLKKMLKMK